MKKEALISVVIPAYNQPAYVAIAIESVLNQTYNNFEIIVVDDGSTDDTRSVIEKFSGKILYIRQENQGLAGARNTGIANARSDLICLLDADDQWLPQYLEKMVEFAAENQGAAIYYCCAQAVDKNGNKLPQVYGCSSKQPGEMLSAMLRANFIIPSTVMMNYSSIKSGDQFDRRFRRLQDWELWIRLLKQGHYFRGLPDVLVNYRIHEESLSMDPERGQQAAMALVTKHFGTDDGKPEMWNPQKRRAFGGAYRYHALSSIQRQKNWEIGATFLSKAFEVDPTLAVDLDLFYDLAFSEQPSGYKDANYPFNIEPTFISIDKMLARIFNNSNNNSIHTLRSTVCGTANYAMGLAAYNAGRRGLGRNLLIRALFNRPELIFDGLVIGNIFKSLFSINLIRFIKGLISKHSLDKPI